MDYMFKASLGYLTRFFKKTKTRPEEVVQLVECLSGEHVALSVSSALHNPGVVSDSQSPALRKEKQRTEKFKVFFSCTE